MNKLSTEETTIDIGHIIGNKKYRFWVKTMTKETTSSTGSENLDYTSKKGLPSRPTDLSGFSAEEHIITLTWTAPTDNGGSPIYEYVIEYKLADKNDYWVEKARTSAD